MKGLTVLRKKLLECGITQKSLSAATNLNPAIISFIASGKLTPSFQQKNRIARALGIKTENLFGEGDKNHVG